MTTSGFAPRRGRCSSPCGFDVVGEAAGGDEALAATAALRPAIVLLDIQLPGRDGFEVAERLRTDAGIAGRDPDLEPGRRGLR